MSRKCITCKDKGEVNVCFYVHVCRVTGKLTSCYRMELCPDCLEHYLNVPEASSGFVDTQISFQA